MATDYKEIGRRLAARRKALGLKQVQVCEMCDINSNYLSNIERAVSIPSLEVVLRLSRALDTTPDTFLVGVTRDETTRWQDIAAYLRTMDDHQLDMAESFLKWLSAQQ